MGLRRPPNDLGFEEVGFEEIQDPNRVTTREQALERAMQVENQNRGFGVEDVVADLVNPIEWLATGGKVIKAGAAGARELMSLGERGLANAAKQAAMNEAVKKGTSTALLEGALESGAQKAAQKINASEAGLRELIKGKTGQINPDVVSEIMPTLGRKMAEKRPSTLVSSPGVMTREAQQAIPLEGLPPQVSEVIAQQGQVPVKAEKLLRIKRAADKQAKFSKSDIMNPQAAPRIEKAARVGDVARRQLYDIAPGSEEVLSQMGTDIKLKNFLQGRAMKNPQSALSGKPGTLKYERLKAADRALGTDLSKTAERLGVARDLADTSITEPVEFAVKNAKKAAYSAAGAGNKALGAVSRSVVPELAAGGLTKEMAQALLPDNRRKNKSTMDDLGFEELGFEEIK